MLDHAHSDRTSCTAEFAYESVAGRLGNTVAVCRKCYIHPAVMEGYLAGTMSRLRLTVSAEVTMTIELRPEESAVLAFLQKQAT